MINRFLKFGFFAITLISLTLVSCGDDENTTGNSVTYDLEERASSDVNGTAKFVELDNGKVQVELSLSGTTNGNSHPAHIHMNSALMGGDILISLDPVDGATGSSVTIVDQTDSGQAFTYAMVDMLDAYINVHKSATELEVVVAQGDIGGNTLTGNEKEYDLAEKDVAGISGKVTFNERKNGNALAVLDIDGTPNGGIHPAHIHMNSAAESGDILISFTPVDGSTGMSMTDIRTDDNGSSLTYNDILNVNGYINVHLSSSELGTIVAQGDIGSNAFTGESITYDLNTKDVAGISGEIKFEQRESGSVLATITLTGTPNGGSHPAHIHDNSAAVGGPIAVSFNPVDGTTGISQTTIRTLDNGNTFNYEMIDTYDGYVNVHLSAAELGTIVAQGNIGANN